MSRILLFTLILASVAGLSAQERRVLVYTRQTATPLSMYIHDNTAASVAALKKLGAENGFAVDDTDDPKVFTRPNLARYKAIVFTNTHNEVFANDDQREAFRDYVRAGGGFVGIHAATTTERSWPWFVSMIGGRFVRHPKLQTLHVRVQDAKHPATEGLPPTFDWDDECYMHDFLNPNLHPLLVTDPSTLEDPERAKYPNDLLGANLPLAWTISTNNQRVFYTVLGHKKEHYTEPILVKHLLGGLLWAMREK